MARNPRDGEASERGDNSASSPCSENDCGEDVEPKKEGVDAGGGPIHGKKTAGSAEIRTINFPNDAVYEGETKDGNQNGRGVYRYANGAVYDGEWKDGKWHGWGTFQSNGNVYEGQFTEGNIHGKGRLKGANGTYDGEWEDNEKHGEGKQTWKSGDVYEGGYKDGSLHGKGTYKRKNGEVYEGEFQDGVKHGRGTQTWPSGKVYEGEFKGGRQHGKGTMKYPTGDIFEGMWTDGQLTQGKETLASGDERKGAGDAVPNTPGCELPERTLRSQRSQQRRLQKKVATKFCEHCGANDYHYKLRVCSRCGLALYCSAACQKAASGSHRRICDIVSGLPSRDSDGLVLLFDKEKANDFDAGLRYGTKYMDNLKHLVLDVEAMSKGDTSIKLSAKQLSSLLKSKRGTLDSVFWLSNDYCNFPARGDEGRRVVEHGPIWKELHDLEQLRLDFMKFDDVQPICDIISQQENNLVVLSLPLLQIQWSRAKCRRSLALAVSSCKHLVNLDLQGSVLMDPDLKVMLHDLPHLRCLYLGRHPKDSHEFTDNTCGLIARKCPGLQELNLNNHDHLSVRGIRRIFEGCVHLRSFYTTSRKLTSMDVQSLLDIAPQLLCLSLGKKVGAADEEIDEVIEATSGRTVIQFSDGINCSRYEPKMTLSAEVRKNYESQIDVLNEIWDRRGDPEVANEWAGM